LPAETDSQLTSNQSSITFANILWSSLKFFVGDFRLRTTISVPHRVVSACQILGADKGEVWYCSKYEVCQKYTHIGKGLKYKPANWAVDWPEVLSKIRALARLLWMKSEWLSFGTDVGYAASMNGEWIRYSIKQTVPNTFSIEKSRTLAYYTYN